MSNPLPFFKIGEANKEITRLTEALNVASEKNKVHESNIQELTDQIELARKDSGAKSIQDLLDAEKLAHTETKKAIVGKDEEIKNLKASQSDFDGKIEKAASAKAGEITGNIGIKPLPLNADANPGDDKKPDLSKLTGLARVEAAFRLQSQKNSPNK